MKVANRFIALPVGRPGLTLLATALWTVLMVAGLPQLRIDSSIESMIVENDPEHAAFESKKQIFGSDEILSVAIPFGDALGAEALSLLRRITTRLEKLQGVDGVDSVANVDDIIGHADELRVEPLVARGIDPAMLDAQSVEEIRKRVDANAPWTGFLISKDRRTAALQVTLSASHGSDAERQAVIAAIDAILSEELGSRAYHLAGHPFMKSEIGRTIQRDLGIFLPVTILVISALALLVTGSRQIVALTLGGALLAVVWMLGGMGWLGLPLTAVSNTAPTILLALATAYLMHVGAVYEREWDERSPEASLHRAFSHSRRPLVLAGATTAVGFGSLWFSQVPFIRSFGLVLSVGMVGIVVIGTVCLPAALAWKRPAVRQRSAFSSSRRLGIALFRIAQITARKPVAVLVSTGLILLLSIIGALHLEIDSSGPNKFSEGSRFRVSSEFYRSQLSGDVVENVYLQGPPGAFKEPEVLRRVQRLQEDLENLPEIDASLSIADYIPLMNRAWHENDPAHERIPDSRGAVAQYLLLYSMSGDSAAFDDLVDLHYGEARILLKATVTSSRASADLRERITELARLYFSDPEWPPAVLSTEISLSRAADTLSREQTRGFTGAFAFILLAVGVGFRSFSASKLMAVPNGAPILLNLGVMGILGIPLNETTSVISAVAIGIAVDSTVHLLASARRLEREHGSPSAGIVAAILTTGRPVIVTGIVVVAGFSLLVLSSFRSVVELGVLTAATMVYCLIADLFILPAQLFAGARWRSGSLCGSSIVLADNGSFATALDLEAVGANEYCARPLGPLSPDFGDRDLVLEGLLDARHQRGRLEKDALSGEFRLRLLPELETESADTSATPVTRSVGKS